MYGCSCPLYTNVFERCNAASSECSVKSIFRWLENFKVISSILVEFGHLCFESRKIPQVLIPLATLGPFSLDRYGICLVSFWTLPIVVNQKMECEIHFMEYGVHFGPHLRGHIFTFSLSALPTRSILTLFNHALLTWSPGQSVLRCPV